jgi:arabinose-5-phosphate isomerase
MPRDIARDVLRIEAEAILALIDRLDERFDRAVEMMLKCRGRVVVSGMGKSGIVGRKIAATLTSTGTPAHSLHPADALHGDLGMVVEGDLLLALSHSGETVELLRLLELLRRLEVPVVALVGQTDSTLARHADVTLDVGVDREACPLGLAPSASTTATLAMGDALALALATRRGFTAEDFARRHPGGRLGFRLYLVRDLMHVGSAVPRVPARATMAEAVAEMTRKGLGMTTVVDDGGCLFGVITDGDLRRHLQIGTSLERVTAGDGCRLGRRDPQRGPLVIDPSEPASLALKRMEEWKVTSLVVVDGALRVEGVIQLHDLWRLQLF